MMLDPEMCDLAASFASFSLNDVTVEQARRDARNHEPPPLDSIDGVRTEVFNAHVMRPEGGDVRILTVRPVGHEPRGGVLHVHGGGYVLGRPELALSFLQRLAVQTGCLVASPDYRLAPEYPFPAAFVDCLLALDWLRKRLAPGKIGVVGDSAGGGLAAALAIAVRNQRGLRLAFQVLLHPMLDDRTVDEAEANPVTGAYVWTRQSNRFGWESVLTCVPGGPDTPVMAAPAREEDLSRLPPALVLVGALDLYLDESIRYAERLNRAGVATDLRIYAGTPHNFLAVDRSRVAQAAEREIVAHIVQNLG
ncbi:alpha/beta hydrolase [Mesorhizobium sp. LNHC209A00]|nr:alpha/beta hydrolase [Mesorhizobium sp. LNHC209A00]